MALAVELQIESDLRSSATSSGDRSTNSTSLTIAALADIVREYASSPGWLEGVRFRVDQRWYRRLYLDPDYDVWVISWMPGQSTGFHDHGTSSGAFIVTTGTLEEQQIGEPTRVVNAGGLRAFGPDYSHDVRNASGAPAISIHAYSPPLTEMNEYELADRRLVPRTDADRLDRGWSIREPGPDAYPQMVTIDGLLTAARSRLRRLSAQQAHEAFANSKAVLVDIRPESQRAAEGSIEGALMVERNVLEWRFDPTSSARLSIAENHDLQVVVFCSEGYTSSLAAVALQELGLWRATDVVGGFQAWREQGLPILEGYAAYSRTTGSCRNIPETAGCERI